MQVFEVTGGRALEGTVTVSGAKNSVLPIMAACLVIGEICVLHNCPDISDVSCAEQILRELGCEIVRQGSTLWIDARKSGGSRVLPAVSGEMRSSVLFLGALSAARGEANIAFPGGCRLGKRPIDLHLQALRELGAEAEQTETGVVCRAERLHGGQITLAYPSVGATENAILCAMGARGEVLLRNAAQEPEIDDLIAFLRSAGASIRKNGSEICIHGGKPLHSTTYTIMPDRIEAATYLCALAGCGGKLCLKRAAPEVMEPVLSVLRQCGCEIRSECDTLYIRREGRLLMPDTVVTQPYPGFPTDVQAPLMAALLCARGEGQIVETVFEDRLRHVRQMKKLGADITVSGRVAIVRGVERLHAADLQAQDLRAGAALTIAALCAEGKSRISGVKYIKRGYDKIEESLAALGAGIKCVEIP